MNAKAMFHAVVLSTLPCSSCRTSPLASVLPPHPELAMVSVPAGTFSMGSDQGDDDERPVHTERVSAFRIETTVTTVASYRKCVKQRGRASADTQESLLQRQWGERVARSTP